MENQFYKISKQLIDVFKASTEGKKPTEKYNSIIYIAIDQLEELHISILPDVLEKAQRCVLMIRYSIKPVNFPYDAFKFYYIDEKYQVRDGLRLDGWYFSYGIGAAMYDPLLILTNNNIRCSFPLRKMTLEEAFSNAWHRYKLVRDFSSEEMCKSIIKYIDTSDKNEKLLKENLELKLKNSILESERNQYKDMLDKLSALLKQK